MKNMKKILATGALAAVMALGVAAPAMSASAESPLDGHVCSNGELHYVINGYDGDFDAFLCPFYSFDNDEGMWKYVSYNYYDAINFPTDAAVNDGKFYIQNQEGEFVPCEGITSSYDINDVIDAIDDSNTKCVVIAGAMGMPFYGGKTATKDCLDSISTEITGVEYDPAEPDRWTLKTAMQDYTVLTATTHIDSDGDGICDYCFETTAPAFSIVNVVKTVALSVVAAFTAVLTVLYWIGKIFVV